MPVYLPTSVLGNAQTLLSLGLSGEIMGWFYPHKDQAQNIYQCLPCVYIGEKFHGHLSWTYDDNWTRTQRYDGDTNVCITEVCGFGLKLTFTDFVPADESVLVRRVHVENAGAARIVSQVFHYGDWNLGGIRMGNGVRFDHAAKALIQSHREVALALGGDAIETWQCGKAGEGWASNAKYDLNDGALNRQDLEIGDVNWACGFEADLGGGESCERTFIFALENHETRALKTLQRVLEVGVEALETQRRNDDRKWLAAGLKSLKGTRGEKKLPEDLSAAYRRSLLCLPLLCGPEGAAVAAPEFDPEFISCGGYGYHWPRDGGEYVSGLLDAGYDKFAAPFFSWCARHQDESGLWHQRYFLNGAPAPNWCLPPDTLQIDQVGAVLWALGKAIDRGFKPQTQHIEMTRRAADYLISRLSERDVHGNAFDTWETFIGSFTYSNAAIYAAFKTAHRVLDEAKYDEAASRIKNGVLKHFVKGDDYPYLVRGLDAHGHDDNTVDSASLGAIDPFGLLDLDDARELEIAEGTLRAITERLDVEWMNGRAIRRFEGDAYVGGVPACVNTLWMARCCLTVANRFDEIERHDDARDLTNRAQVYLQTVLRRATPTGLLPELMQGPTGQSYWAAPHGWAMSSFVSGTLMLAKRLAKR